MNGEKDERDETTWETKSAEPDLVRDVHDQAGQSGVGEELHRVLRHVLRCVHGEAQPDGLHAATVGGLRAGSRTQGRRGEERVQ